MPVGTSFIFLCFIAAHNFGVDSLSHQCVSHAQSCANTGTTLCRETDPAAYNYNKSTTKQGVECQPWNVRSPHVPSYGSQYEHNYCRNPDAYYAPWCYTTDRNIRFDLCFADCCSSSAPRDCGEIKESNASAASGIYTIRLKDTLSGCFSSGGFVTNGICCTEVYCDMDTFGGGWMVFQKRFNGSQNFFLNFATYKVGFGQLNGEFWAGNQFLYDFTQRKTYELLVELYQTERNCSLYAEYASFRLTNSIYYTTSIGNYRRGTAGDSLLNQHNGSPFSTYDVDNDDKARDSCASMFHGAWWYKKCHSANLNGKHLGACTNERATGMTWRSARGHFYSFGRTEMKLRPADYSMKVLTLDNKFCTDSSFNPCPRDCSWNEWGSWGSCQLPDSCALTGTRNRTKTMNLANGGMACIGSNINSESCEGNGCSADLPSVIELEVHCNNIQGVMVGSSCFILDLESSGWADHWTECTKKATTISHSEPWKYKGRLGHLYSTDIITRVGKYLNTSTTVPSSILASGLAIGAMKMDANSTTTQDNIFWMQTAEQRFTKSMSAYMIDESKVQSPFMADQCFMIKLIERNQWKLATSACTAALMGRLCEIVAPAQKYLLKYPKQKLIYNLGFLEESTESDAWECGLACRKAQGCVSFNHQQSTGLCKLFGVKYPDVSGSANITNDESFNYYERFF